MRIILYLGKGGVGKTTTAAASALRSAEMGFRTLVVSTDIAHSLADSLDTALSAQPVEVAPNLFAQEINVVEEIRRNWGKMQGYLGNVLRKQGMNKAVADEMAIIPGMEEMVSLLHINKQAQEGNFDRVIVDAAPTGEDHPPAHPAGELSVVCRAPDGVGRHHAQDRQWAAQSHHARQGSLYRAEQSVGGRQRIAECADQSRNRPAIALCSTRKKWSSRKAPVR